MTKLIQRMREELVRRNFAETTIRSYLQTMEDFRRFIQKRLDQVSTEEIRKYQVHLLEERKLEPGTVAYRVAALRFFYVRTLKRPAMKEDLPYPHSPKHARRLPTILTPEEVSRLIDSARAAYRNRGRRTTVAYTTAAGPGLQVPGQAQSYLGQLAAAACERQRVHR